VKMSGNQDNITRTKDWAGTQTISGGLYTTGMVQHNGINAHGGWPSKAPTPAGPPTARSH
jgi:hypothetical protein